MISPHVRADILKRLAQAEAQHGVRVLLAIESGSRAWGFASPNSDYDVRFIYVHPPAWYQAVDLEERRDVIEYPIVDEIDINGWDVRKALRLYWKSNPGFVEWIQSPITYVDRGAFRSSALRLLPEIYAPERGIYHYLSMARKNYRGYLRESVVPLKKYFYVLRPLLAARWIAQTGMAAPVAFAELLSLLQGQPELLAEIDKLLEQKSQTPEMGRCQAVPILNRFIESELADFQREIPEKSDAPEVMAALNALFHTLLEEA
ncbi:MAG: DNA polymerase beta superfamily protein [Candidatus Sericytochromatia bacterium]